MDTLKLRLTIDVEYELNGAQQKTLENLLHEIADDASGDGYMTGDTEATVKHWSAKVTKVT